MKDFILGLFGYSEDYIKDIEYVANTAMSHATENIKLIKEIDSLKQQLQQQADLYTQLNNELKYKTKVLEDIKFSIKYRLLDLLLNDLAITIDEDDLHY